VAVPVEALASVVVFTVLTDECVVWGAVGLDGLNGLNGLNGVARIQCTPLISKPDFRYATTQSMLREAASESLSCAPGEQS